MSLKLFAAGVATWAKLVQLAPSISRNVPGGSYEITKKLPERDGEFEYRIKSINEPHERVARESELRGL